MSTSPAAAYLDDTNLIGKSENRTPLPLRIHVTRHAQPGPYVPKPGDDPQIPPGDKGITELGERQSLWLGERLVELGFKGTIHSSP